MYFFLTSNLYIQSTLTLQKPIIQSNNYLVWFHVSPLFALHWPFFSSSTPGNREEVGYLGESHMRWLDFRVFKGPLVKTSNAGLYSETAFSVEVTFPCQYGK